MATLAFAAAGAALGSSLLPAGLTLFGTTLTGAAIGAQFGALGGGLVDQALFGASGQSRSYEGPRLSELRVLGSTEGAAIPKAYGRARIGGQVIWASEIEEEATTEEAGGGGKGGFSGGAAQQTTYAYFSNFAVGLCEGEIAGISRIWTDGAELDQTNAVMRVYPGSESQLPDSLISAHAGSGLAPAYRGVAYVVFERLPLAAYGNRIPQLSFEVVRPLGKLGKLLKGVVMIPGSGEFAYATEAVTRKGEDGADVSENAHMLQAATDWDAALDQLSVDVPNVENVSLVTSWFGSDLRAGVCQIRPGVERLNKVTQPLTWSVAGQSRADAYVVSEIDGRPAYGGTPSDQSVVQAIADLKGRGIGVTLTPFILMDVPEGNALPNPYSPDGVQSPYPWRGRITIDPAAGVAGSPDQTASAAGQLASFVGTAQPGDFSLAGQTVNYAGPQEWSFRRFVLHHAFLALAAGGVDTFVIGTELRGLSTVRSGPSTYPFVSALVLLAADVKSVLGTGTNVTYAADWSEYFGHQPADGSGDVHFHLDSLWSSANIDAIGIDLYWALSDWRDTPGHADLPVARSIYDLDYLKGNLEGGEGYDWYYASASDREAQVRSPITDGAGKPWVFRYKDLRAWWSNEHYNRPGGVESAVPTTWVPGSKPVWFMEVGCPAVDKGANQPNVFYDPKSSESSLPYFGRDVRDDLIQRRYLRAIAEAYDASDPAHVPGLNPTSASYGGPMVDPSRIYAYAWDARPFPAFPADTETWSDGPNWQFGHWLNGRLSACPLDELVEQVLADLGDIPFDASELTGIVPGYVIDRIMPAREALQPLELAYFFDSIETSGQIMFRHRGGGASGVRLTEADAVEGARGAGL
ncbi:MAG TPA: glycoside hydrolase TIM-barrel-like domain-containing protein [Hyphomicrobiaceae bacterium]|nr:glycoside hydrolase TIM-barrel-like domain-containing protein [Hyphomicrobiaceae bacterium]